MGRQLRRVPLDFDWPLRKVWKGFVNPHSGARVECTDCAGSGYSPEAKLFSDQWYGYAPFDPVEYGAMPLTVDHPGVQAFARRNVNRAPTYYARHGETIEQAVHREAARLFSLWQGQWNHHLIQADVDALVADGRLYEFTRRPRTQEQADDLAAAGGSWMREWNGYTPTADEVNAWSIDGFGHDGINAMICIRARCQREGVPVRCSVCAGDGSTWATPEDKRLYDEWKDYEPPQGEGYQLWETVSEGSPISPVFATESAFIEYLIGEGCSRSAAENFIRSGWAPSGVIRDGDVVRDIESHAMEGEA